jgi:hypothetical protein
VKQRQRLVIAALLVVNAALVVALVWFVVFASMD